MERIKVGFPPDLLRALDGYVETSPESRGSIIRSAVLSLIRHRAALEVLSDKALVELNIYMLDKRDDPSCERFSMSISVEADRRGWPDGWYEDPSVVIGCPGGGAE